MTLPELAVPPHVFVLPLPADGRPSQLLDQWLEQAAELPGSPLAGHRDELLAILTAACGEAQVGEVAAFLSYRRVSTGSGGSGGSRRPRVRGPADGADRADGDGRPGSWAEPPC